MTNRISKVLNALNFNSINRLSFQNDKKSVAVEFVDNHENIHKVEFSSVDTYFFLDENILDCFYENNERKEPITFFDGEQSEFIAVDEFEDGTVCERKIAQPNIILNTENASILMEAKKVTINGESYQLDKILN